MYHLSIVLYPVTRYVPTQLLYWYKLGEIAGREEGGSPS